MGIGEILLIALALLVLFGARKIPELMKGIGKGINEFNSEKNKSARSSENDTTED